jgi:hypothetical protein
MNVTSTLSLLVPPEERRPNATFLDKGVLTLVVLLLARV